jgi:hypothetical protein
MNESCKYSCNICNKKYASSNSLWNHNKKFHTKIASDVGLQNPNGVLVPTVNNCKFCKKSFNNRQNKYRHEKICKSKDNKIDLLEKEIIELKNMITTTNNSKIVNKNTNNTNNINHGTINNNTFIINKIGEESISKLKFKDIKNIFREQKNCLYHAIKYVNFNDKIPENHSFYNSSLEGKYINVFNNDNNEIEKKNKKDFFDSILLSSINITNLLYDKFKNDLSKKKQLKLQNMIKEIENIAHLDNNKKLYITNFICTQ